MVSDTLRLGLVTRAALKMVASPLPGTPPVQLPAVLKSVPVLFQVLSSAYPGCWLNETSEAVRAKRRKSAAAEARGLPLRGERSFNTLQARAFLVPEAGKLPKA